jgi:hypothetical protein
MAAARYSKAAYYPGSDDLAYNKLIRPPKASITSNEAISLFLVDISLLRGDFV